MMNLGQWISRNECPRFSTLTLFLCAIPFLLLQFSTGCQTDKSSSEESFDNSKIKVVEESKKKAKTPVEVADPIAAAIASKKNAKDLQVAVPNNKTDVIKQQKAQSKPNYYPVSTTGFQNGDFGIRKLESRHLRLYTDHLENKSIVTLPAVFDLAVQQWCAFFQTDPSKSTAWKVDAFVMVSEEKFRKAKLLPKLNIPAGGVQQGNQIWVRVKPGDYYTRHLLLHEGTHAFCWFHHNSLGPPFLSEGLAEYLALHRWDGKKLELAAKGITKKQVPYWGRIRTLRDAIKNKSIRSFRSVVGMDGSEFPKVSAYAWAWAAVSLLDNHPKTKDLFRRNLVAVIKNQMSIKELLNSIKDFDEKHLETNWIVMISHMDYGLEPGRVSVKFLKKERKFEQKFDLVISSENGWTEVGNFQKGTVRISASGKICINKEVNQVWNSTADGVTIQYYKGHPIGCLMAVFVPNTEEDQRDESVKKWLTPIRIGIERETSIDRSSKLFLKINDDPLQLKDNSGSFQVTVEAVN